MTRGRAFSLGSLGMRVGRRAGLGQTLSDTDDPIVRAQNNVVELGRFTVTGR